MSSSVLGFGKILRCHKSSCPAHPTFALANGGIAPCRSTVSYALASVDRTRATIVGLGLPNPDVSLKLANIPLQYPALVQSPLGLHLATSIRVRKTPSMVGATRLEAVNDAT